MRFSNLGAIVSLLFVICPLLGQEEEEKDSFFYADVGSFLLAMPTGGIGYRTQLHKRGLDLSLRASTLGVASQIKLSILSLYFPMPNFYSQYYAGIGGGASYFICAGIFKGYSTFSFSPEFLIGKQYITPSYKRHILQIQFQIPIYVTTKIGSSHMIYIPIPTFSYGFLY